MVVQRDVVPDLNSEIKHRQWKRCDFLVSRSDQRPDGAESFAGETPRPPTPWRDPTSVKPGSSASEPLAKVHQGV